MRKSNRARIQRAELRKQRPPAKSAIQKFAVVLVGLIALLALFTVFVAGTTPDTMIAEPLEVAGVQADMHPDHPPTHSGHTTGQAFEPLIDGAQQPDLIPDPVAIRALMQTLRLAANTNETSFEQLRTRLARVNLSNADMQILLREIEVLDRQIMDQQQHIESLRPSSEAPDHAEIARFIEEHDKLGSLIVDHYDALRASLSPEGAMKLHDHLNHVKSRIRIYPTPDMSANID